MARIGVFGLGPVGLAWQAGRDRVRQVEARIG